MPPVFEYKVILPYPGKPRFLLFPQGNGWDLPGWKTVEPEFWQVVGAVNRVVKDLLGCTVVTLRMVYDAFDPETNTYLNIYELETLELSSELENPESGSWVGRGDLAHLELANHELRPVLQTWLDETESGRPLPRRAWSKLGWFETAAKWIEEKCAKLNLKIIPPIEQVRTWERSCVLLADTSGGKVYFKAVPEWLSQEIPVSLFLAETLPHNSPQFLAPDTGKNWLLTADFGGQTLDKVPELEKWETAVRQLAQLQIHSSWHLETLKTFCPVRLLAALEAQIDPFFNELETYTHNHWSSLTFEEIALLKAQVSRLKDLCSELGNFELPLTLEHGDLGPTNIAVRGEDYIFFDWSDSSISHPFFSLWGIVNHEMSDKPAEVGQDWLGKIKQAYLAEWREYGPVEKLETALDLALKLAPLHFALNYHYRVLPQMEARWEMESMVPFYLRRLLK